MELMVASALLITHCQLYQSAQHDIHWWARPCSTIPCFFQDLFFTYRCIINYLLIFYIHNNTIFSITSTFISFKLKDDVFSLLLYQPVYLQRKFFLDIVYILIFIVYSFLVSKSENTVLFSTSTLIKIKYKNVF